MKCGRLQRWKETFLTQGHKISDFSSGAMLAAGIQLHSRNFQGTKKMDPVKAYYFRLLEVYWIDAPTTSILSIPEKCRRGGEEWMITQSQTKKTCSSINPLERIVITDNEG